MLASSGNMALQLRMRKTFNKPQDLSILLPIRIQGAKAYYVTYIYLKLGVRSN